MAERRPPGPRCSLQRTYRDRLTFPHYRDFPQRPQRKSPLKQGCCFARQHRIDGELLAKSLQPRRGVNRISDRGEVRALGWANRSENDLSGMDANTEEDLLFTVG